MPSLTPLPSGASAQLKPVPVKTTFISDGVRCAATLHLPAGHGAGPVPAILMVHGWGGIQDGLTPPFYEEFTESGFAVMTFDYPGWGDSEGMPRNMINPWSRVRSAESALAHLKSLPQIDPRKVVLWGTSLGGGHVVDLAAKHPELLGAIAQVPMLDGLTAAAAVSPLRALQLGFYALADLLSWRGPVYIPVIASPGQFGTMDRDGADEALTRISKQAGKPYDNRVGARSVLTMGLYRPFKRLKQVCIPTLLVIALRDTVAPFPERRMRRTSNPMLTVRWLDANHFEPYCEPVFTANIAHQRLFLKSLLPAC